MAGNTIDLDDLTLDTLDKLTRSVTALERKLSRLHQRVRDEDADQPSAREQFLQNEEQLERTQKLLEIARQAPELKPREEPWDLFEPSAKEKAARQRAAEATERAQARVEKLETLVLALEAQRDELFEKLETEQRAGGKPRRAPRAKPAPVDDDEQLDDDGDED